MNVVTISSRRVSFFSLFALFLFMPALAQPQMVRVMPDGEMWQSTFASDEGGMQLNLWQERQGSVLQQLNLFGTGQITLLHTAQGTDGSVWVVGSFTGILSGPGQSFSPTGENDLFLAVFDPHGNPIRIRRIGGVHEDALLALDALVDGTFQVQVSTNPNALAIIVLTFSERGELLAHYRNEDFPGTTVNGLVVDRDGDDETDPPEQ